MRSQKRPKTLRYDQSISRELTVEQIQQLRKLSEKKGRGRPKKGEEPLVPLSALKISEAKDWKKKETPAEKAKSFSIKSSSRNKSFTEQDYRFKQNYRSATAGQIELCNRFE